MAGLMTAVDTDRDRDLLAMHLSGDPAAFGELYAQHYDRLLRHVRQRVRDWHLAEEIVQDTFVRAYEAAAHLKDHRRFYPWVRVIADRLAVDVFRRDGRVSPVAEFDEIGHEPAADERLIAASEAEALRAALGRVRERHRQVLDWQNNGLSYQRIAERLDTPVTTVPPLLFRARQALRREYLALTEAERIAAVPVLGAGLAWFRRWRLRGTQFASCVPEPGMFTAQFATVILVIGSGLGYSGPTDVRFGDTGAGSASGMPAPIAEGTVLGSAVSPLPGPVLPQSDEPTAATPRGLAPPKVVGVGGPGRAEAMEHARNAPYRAEFGPVGLGLDPAGDAEYVRDAVMEAGAP